MIAKMKRSLWVGMAVVVLGGVFLTPVVSATPNENSRQVWVCKYVGKPGVDERLKEGKNPNNVSSSATVGTWFKDGQNNSFVLDVVTENNDNGQGNSYSGDKTCPTGSPVLKDASVTWSISPATCLVPEILTHSGVNATATGTPSGTSGPKPSFSFTYTANDGHLFANGSSTETHNGKLDGKKTVGCGGEPQPVVATAGVDKTPATCTVPETLKYINVSKASATPGSTANNTVGPLESYSVTFVADPGAMFAPGAQTTFTGSLNGVLTGLENCPEDGDVLGGTTTTPPVTTATPTPSAPAVLPATTGESTAAIVLGGSLLAVVLGFAGARRILARSL